MNKTDRMLAIVLKLQSAGKGKAEDLAKTFETSKRTIYRDIQALSEAGVPIIAVPGQGYALQEGYFLPPLSFSSEEATMLLLGGEYIAQNLDDHYKAGVRTACLKIETVLPHTVKQEVNQLRDQIQFVPVAAPDTPFLKEIRRAVLERRVLRFSYHSRTNFASVPAKTTEREADPYSLTFYDGAWYMAAYCHSHQDVRNFRLERIEQLTLLPKTFVRPPNFKAGLAPDEFDTQFKVTAQVLFEPSVARWVKEARFFYVTAYQDTPQGLLVTLRLRQIQDAVQWLLSWGRNVKVLAPLELGECLQTEAALILQMYQTNNI
jgi:predicted DNA-binding transcriptional regulator YafY